LTFTAAVSGLYRISAVARVSTNTTSIYTRINSTTPVTFVSQPESRLIFGATSTMVYGTLPLQIQALVRVEAGRPYTFNVEYNTGPTTPCALPTLEGMAPLVAEQLN